MKSIDDVRIGENLARAAGEELLRVRRESGLAGKELGNAGDAAAQSVLAALLAEHRPDDAVLSEEAKDSAARLSAERVWIIDPLDGTREFSEGRADWAVHIALWIAGELALGVVGIPGEDLVLSSADVAAAPEPAEGSPLRLAVSRSRPPAVTEPVRASLDAELLPMGSAGVKIAAVVRGQVDAYVHAGGQYEWDSAAPVALARAAGLHTSRIDGSPLVYNSGDPYLPDLIVCRPVLAPRILAAISDYTDGDS
ncbi:3'(2'),5'-bisphosphate nucleotidase CysQ [Demequina soli]|uniref:3'(2'),5'-bisphosphate nucleotidase CysQ n=1 Tax=Demequina soli TaxID=1638987 RepID=UPI000AE464E4|nr:3'(2'),5'-bisphosphate nucleotidase CysQ [Demequina soli]